MKQTVFQFWLRLTGDQSDQLVSRIVATIKAIKGVDEAEADLHDTSAALRVHARFPDSTAAKKLHRKLMTTLMKMDGVTITRVTTDLTDVFG